MVSAVTKAAKRKTNKSDRKLLKTIVVLFCMGVIVCCIIGTIATIFLIDMIKNRTDIDISNLNLNFTTTIYANDRQNSPYEVERIHSAENRIWIDYEDIPSYVGMAAIAAEDQRFMQHNGIDFKRIAFAIINEVFHFSGRQGASTITQQLVKNVTGDNEISFLRKAREMISAVYLEKQATKEDILGAYLNVVYFGNNTNGIEAAARLYFDKSAKDLTLQEAVAIISITEYPVYYDLFLHPENNEKRRKYILSKMLKLKFITKEEYDEAINSKLVVSDHNNPKTKKVYIYNYFIEYLIEDVINSLVEKYGYSRKYAAQQIYKGGYRIYSTMDEKIQAILQDRYENSSAFSHVSGSKDKVQSAMIVLDNHGRIKGLVGGRGKKTINFGWNRATIAKRSPGSAIKPISVYALAVEKNLLNYSSLVKDEPRKLNGKDWPHNAYGYYMHNMLLPLAIAQSSNAVSVNVCDKIGPEHCFNFMKNKLHMESLVESKIKNKKIFSDINLASMALGSLTDGTTVKELTAAYQVFSNGGLYYKPHAYYKVLDSHGNVVLENNEEPERVISKSTSIIINKLLQNVVNSSQGTGRAARLKNFEVAGKTGTTSDDKDVWFIGSTPYYTAGVWVGYDKPCEMYNLWPSYPPTNIWREVMEKIHEGLPAAKFSKENADIVSRKYCNRTGLLASPTCTDCSEGIYRTQNIPAYCPGHSEPVKNSQTDTDAESTQSTQSIQSTQSTQPTQSIQSTQSAQPTQPVLVNDSQLKKITA